MTAITRRLFSGLAAVAPAAIAKAPAGLALGREAGLAGAIAQQSTFSFCTSGSVISPAAQLVWDQIHKASERREKLRSVAAREAAGILDPAIQALTACSPVYRMHLQMQKDERAESIIQKLRDRIGELERLGG